MKKAKTPRSKKRSKSRKSGKKQVKEQDEPRSLYKLPMTQLQFIARNRGIPFGGLTKSDLIRKINHYEK